MMKKFSPLLLLAILTQASCQVLQLTEDNFDEMTAGKTIFIKFFAPWCGHCQSMAPAWEQLASDWKDHAIGLVAEVDCTDPAGQSVCEDFEVQGFPTLVYGDPRSPEIYEGEREYESLAAFAKERIGKPVCSIHYVEHCSEDEKVIIDGLRTKPREELEALESSVADRVQAAQEIYDASVEDLSARFEEITTKFNSEIDAIRAETNFKWVQQILSSLSNDHDPEATDEVNDEL